MNKCTEEKLMTRQNCSEYLRSKQVLKKKKKNQVTHTRLKEKKKRKEKQVANTNTNFPGFFPFSTQPLPTA